MEKVIPLFLFWYSIGLVDKISIRIPLLFLCLFLLISIVKRKADLSIFLLTFIIAVVVLSKTVLQLPSLFFINENCIKIVGGKIISIPSYRGSEKRGYSILVSHYSDGEGNWFSGGGKIYVISKLGDEDIGDEVILKGVMMDGFFLSSSSVVVKRSVWGRGRVRFLSFFRRTLRKGKSGNLTSLFITGTTIDGEREIQDAGESLGLSHLFALSGMHLAFIITMIGKPLEKFLGIKKGRILSLMVAFIFIYINGFRPSLFRAFLLLLLTPYFGTGYSLVLSLLIMMKVSPGIMTDYGAALSYVALSGILIFASGWKKSVAPIMTTIGALTTTIPFSLFLFSSWSLSSLLLSIPGGIVIELLFVLIVINIFIPKLDSLIEIFYDAIIKISKVFPSFTQNDLKYYWPILFISLFLLFINKAFPFIKRWIIMKTCGTSTTTALKRLKEY